MKGESSQIFLAELMLIFQPDCKVIIITFSVIKTFHTYNFLLFLLDDALLETLMAFSRQ